MPSPGSPELATVDDDDENLRRALDDAHLPSLLAALALALGEPSLLRSTLRLNPSEIALPQGGLSDSQQEEAKELLLDSLILLRNRGYQPAPFPDRDLFPKFVEFFAAGMDLAQHTPMLREELALSGDDPRRPQWSKNAIAPDRPFHVVVIGAGMSGILAAYRLKQAGVQFTVLEKNRRVGGTWTENRYPGCRVDIASHYYCYSFAQRRWSQFFSPQAELEQYFSECVDDFGIADRIRFGTEVDSARFDDESATWSVSIRNADGAEEVLTADAVISAVGQLNRPLIPEIPGRDVFSGPAFHSANWQHDVDLAGKRVAVIGTGCSAVQFAPLIAQDAAHVTVFQRTPNWMVARPDYKSDVPAGFQWLLHHVPYYREWYRLFLFWSTAGWAPSPADVDPAWGDEDHSVSAMNDGLRALLTQGMRTAYADRPDLLDRVLPGYPPASKRLIVDGGDWARMLKQDNVELVTIAIDHIDEDGITTVDGVHHPLDVIIYGTGFRASQFLAPMKVTGRQGVDLHGLWDGDDSRAYLGSLVTGFPNFFILYGPNTNLVVSGSIIWFSESTVRYIMKCLETVLESGYRALDLKQEVFEAFNREIDMANERRAWAVSRVNSWYKNSRGRSTQNWPFSLLDYWQRTTQFDLAEFETV
jgi:4-hydroxyacetophenone monooxygenase